MTGEQQRHGRRSPVTLLQNARRLTTEAPVELNAVYAPSEDVVARDIEGELLLVPLAEGIGDMEDEFYTLNETGRAIWDALDGRRTVRQVAAVLAQDYDAPADQIERGVIGLLGELRRRKMVVPA